MNVTEEGLREHYRTLETGQLIELQAQGTLTDMAARVLEQVLAERSVPSEERAKLTSEITERVSAEREAKQSLASLGQRLGAQLIDTALTVVILTLSFLFGIVATAITIIGAILAFVYLLLADGLPGGQSVGKRALGIAVIDRRTRAPCTYGQSFLRNFLLMMLGVIDWVFIFGDRHQRLGDMAANTIVVRLKHPGANAA
ncbi:MAG TPA: RDD family protein [Steroidobacteraceae bacterium]|jgi:uncharacterized RDD family membrane protein YckC